MELDLPLEDLWAKIANIQRVAAFGHVPLAEVTIITLTLAMIEKTRLLATTTEKFRLRPLADWTFALFKADFVLGNKERICRLTAGDAGYHGAHHAVSTPSPPSVSGDTPAVAAAAVTPTTALPPCRCTSCHSRRGQDVLLLDAWARPASQLYFPHVPPQSRGPPPPLLHQSFTAVQSATPTELVAFAHATLFSPAVSTLDTALSRG